MAISRKTGELYYTNEEKENALHNNNALEYALSRGYHLVKSGSHYYLKEHDSMMFTPDGRWFWNSKGLNGRAIDFIQHYENLSYTEALLTLAGTLNDMPPRTPVMMPPVPVERAAFIAPEASPIYNAAFFYLQNVRKINPELINRLAQEKKIYQAVAYTALKICGYNKDGTALYVARDPDTDVFKEVPQLFSQKAIASLDGETPISAPQLQPCISSGDAERLVANGKGTYGYRFQNLAMVGLDKDGHGRYTSLRSTNTQGKAFKVDAVGSDKSYPFMISGDTGTTTVCVLESPIEAMSYWSLCKATDSDHLHADMISLGGAGVHLALDRYLKEHPQVQRIVLGLNNDSLENGHKIAAGQNGTEKILQAHAGKYDISVHSPHMNDWNDVLKSFHQMKLGSLINAINERAAPALHRQPPKVTPER